MSFLAKTFEKFDKAMGIESVSCKADDPQALALVNAGLGLLRAGTEVTSDTKLSAIAPASELLAVLKNLDAVYLRRGDLTLGNDIINDVTVGEMISHLDSTNLNTLITTMIEGERREASNVMHTDLSDLEKQINA